MFLICLIYLFCFYGYLKLMLKCDAFVLAFGGGFGGRLLVDFLCRSIVNDYNNICMIMKNLQGSYWHLFHWWGNGIFVPMLPLISIPVFWWLVWMCICSIWRNMCIQTQYPSVFHIWERTVLRYHDFKVNNPYPFLGIKFMTILNYFIIQIHH